jgi:hypothetical protein
MKLSKYVMAPEPISTAYFINPSSVCVCVCVCVHVYVYTLLLLGSGSVKHYRGNAYKCSSWRIVGHIVFFAVRIISKESRRLVLPRTSCLILIFFLEVQRGSRCLAVSAAVKFTCILHFQYLFQYNSVDSWSMQVVSPREIFRLKFYMNFPCSAYLLCVPSNLHLMESSSENFLKWLRHTITC